MKNPNDERYILFLRGRDSLYEEGIFKSKHYTKEELAEKRKYFESKLPHPKSRFSKARWLYEIKRQFELNKDFEKYPDASFCWLEYLIKYGS